MTAHSTAPAAPITVREVLRLFWEADHYPILGNADARDAFALDLEARAKAAHAMPSSDDPPEFAQWLGTLLKLRLANDEREAVYSAIRSYFDPSDDAP
jgi:hypothetical protein